MEDIFHHRLLAGYDRLDCFKLYLFDTGLLKCISGIDNRAILLKSDFQFRDPLTENFVLQQLKGCSEVQNIISLCSFCV